MKEFFKPKSVAIIGASKTKGKIGNILIENLKPKKKKIKIFPVNPKGGKINGLRVYTSVLDIAQNVDLAVIAVPAVFVNQVVEECAWKNQPIKNIIIISAGFGEIGGDGSKREGELKKIIKKYQLNVLGPNCLGTINASENINLSFAKSNVIEGEVGLISQSGAFITSMLDVAEKEHFGFSLVASLGNKIDINENDLLEYYVKNPETKIIAMYLENISDGKKFQAKLKRATKIKPVILIKAGNSQRTKEAIQSHTGSMAGESIVVKTAVEDAGGIIVDNLEDFVNLIKILNNFLLPKINKFPKVNKGLVIVTNAGGPGVITTDLLESYNLKLYEFSSKEKEMLRKDLPKESSVNNPIDLIGDAKEDRYQTVLDKLKKIKKIGGVLVIVTPQAQTPIKEIMEKVVECNRQASFPVFPIVIGGEARQEAEEVATVGELNNFDFPVVLIRALQQLGWWRKNNQETKRKHPKENKEKNNTNKKLLLSYAESEKYAHEFGLNIVPAKYPTNLQKLKHYIQKIGLPIVMKVDSPNIIHKNVKNGVVIGLQTVKDAEKEFRRFRKDFPGEKILIQPQVEKGLEIIMGLKRDSSFGLVLVIGLGGIITEIIDEKILLVGGVTKNKIVKKLENSKLYVILQKEKIKVEQLADQAVRLFELGMLDKNIVEIDVNPIFLYKDKSPVIVDFKIMKTLVDK